MKQTLNYFQRLHEHQDFESALRTKAFIDKWVAVHWETNLHGANRLGIVLSKRTVPHAVNRNRIKRLIRETFRTEFCQQSISYNIVIRLRKNVSVGESQDFRQTMSRLLTKVRMTENDSSIHIVYKGLSVSD